MITPKRASWGKFMMRTILFAKRTDHNLAVSSISFNVPFYVTRIPVFNKKIPIDARLK